MPTVTVNGCQLWYEFRGEGPNLVQIGGAVSAHELSDADLFRKVDRFELAMIQQPLQHDDLIDHAELLRRIGTPALATLENYTYPADIFPSDRFYDRDLAGPLVRFETGEAGGRFAIPEAVSGILQEPDPDRLEELTFQRTLVEAA